MDRDAVDVLRIVRASAASVSGGISGSSLCSFGPGLRVALRPPAPTSAMRSMRSSNRVAIWPETMPPNEKPAMAKRLSFGSSSFIAASTQCVTDQMSFTSSGGSLSPSPGRSAA